MNAETTHPNQPHPPFPYPAPRVPKSLFNKVTTSGKILWKYAIFSFVHNTNSKNRTSHLIFGTVKHVQKCYDLTGLLNALKQDDSISFLFYFLHILDLQLFTRSK